MLSGSRVSSLLRRLASAQSLSVSAVQPSKPQTRTTKRIVVPKSGFAQKFYSTTATGTDSTTQPIHAQKTVILGSEPWPEDRPKPHPEVNYHRRVMAEFGHRMAIYDLAGWYRVSDDDIVRREEPNEIVQIYGNIVFTMEQLYPDHKWESWRWSKIPDGYWDDMRRQREYFDWLFTHLKLKVFEDWYNVSYKDIRRSPGGYVLFTHYQDNTKKALMTIYHEYKWDEPRFDLSPQAYWDSLAENGDTHIKSYLEHVAKQLNVQKADDWYRISRVQLRKIGAAHVIKKYGGIAQILKRTYPKFKWQTSKFISSGKKSMQRFLKLRVEELFPELEILEEFRPGEMTFQRSKTSNVTLDIYIPTYRLAFEYQGAHHYDDVFNYGQKLQGRDSDPEKTALCIKEGITLIAIPHWWDTELDSLANTVHLVRPDLIKAPVGLGKAIPDEPPKGWSGPESA